MTGRSHALPPEFALLAACALLDTERLAEVAPPLARNEGFDWDRFVELGLFHGVAQVARARLDAIAPGAIPARHAEALKRLAVQDAALYAAHARLTVRILAALAAHDLPALVLKGAGLAGQLYAPVPELRASSDIDILVPEDRFAAADRILRDAGLARDWPEADVPPDAMRMFLRLDNVFEYAGPVSGERVELHCRATVNPHALPVSFEELSAASVAVETGHGTIPTPGGPLLTAYLCQHLLWQPPYRLKWLGDIARVLRQAGAASCADHVASYLRPLPLRPARLTDEVLAWLGQAIGQAAGGPAAAAPGRRAARVIAALQAPRDHSQTRTLARLPFELGLLLSVVPLVSGWRGVAYETLLALADPRDAVSLRLTPRFAAVYAVTGPILALFRYARRGKQARIPQD